MGGQVPNRVKKSRVRQLINHSDRQWSRFCATHIGQSVAVLWESMRGATPDGMRWTGLAGNYLRVEVTSREPLENRIRRVQITGVDNGTATGTLLE